MKGIAEKTIKKYIPSLKLESKKITLKNMPIILSHLYDFEELHIAGQPFLVIHVKDKKLGPREFKKHAKIFKDIICYHQIWYLNELHFNKIQRMMENELDFIVEDKHIYLPTLHILIKPENTLIKNSPSKISSMSINMLIREILKGDLSGKNKLQLAELFNTTQMTAGRAISALLDRDLCSENKIGISKVIKFQERSNLWNFLKQNIKSPVEETTFINETPRKLPYSGISALSKLSMLADDNIETFALDKKQYKKLLSKSKIVLEEFAKTKIELWNRAPILLENNCINIIDLFLITQNEKDDRVQSELETLLKKHDLGL